MEKIKVGIFGAGRGMYLAYDFVMLNCDVVAVCDNNEDRLQESLKNWDKGIAVYRDFDSFLEHDIDAVVLANFFHEHAPYAIKCFEKVIEISPEYPYAYYSLGMSYELKDMPERAIEYYHLYTGIETDEKMIDMVNQRIKQLEANE